MAETLVHRASKALAKTHRQASAETEGGSHSLPRWRELGQVCWIAIFALVGYLIGAERYDLLTDDEIRYAEAGRQMLVRGDWLVPVYNGEPRFQKPLLIYWLQAISQSVFGSNALVARIPSAVAAVVALLATWWWARNLCDAVTARWAVLVLGTMLEFVLLARMVLIEMLLLACLQLANAAVVAAWCTHRPTARRWFYRLAGLALGGAICAKGPIAGVLFLFMWAPWIGWLWQKRAVSYASEQGVDACSAASDAWDERSADGVYVGDAPLRNSHSAGKTQRGLALWRSAPIVSALALATLLGLPSYVLPHLRTEGEFTWQFFLTENWQRLTSVINEHPQPWWFYVALLLPLSFPWTGALPGALYLAWDCRRHANDWRGWFPLALLGHVALVFGFFTLSRTKVWTYTFPAYASLALLIAHWLVQRQRRDPELLRRRLRQALGLGTCLGLLGALGVTIWPEGRLPEEVRVPEFLWALRSWAWCLALMLAVCWLISWLASRIRIVLATLIVGAIGIYALAVFVVMPAADRMWNAPVRHLAALWQRYPQAEVITYHVHELGLNFLARRDLVHHWRGEALPDLYERLQHPHPVFVLVDPQLLHHLQGLPIYVWQATNRYVLVANMSPPQVQAR